MNKNNIEPKTVLAVLLLVSMAVISTWIEHPNMLDFPHTNGDINTVYIFDWQLTEEDIIEFQELQSLYEVHGGILPELRLHYLSNLENRSDNVSTRKYVTGNCGIEFDGNESYTEVLNNVEFPKDNISIITYVNLDTSIKNITSEKNNENIQYFDSIAIKSNGWHLVSTDIFNSVYLDDSLIIRRMNQEHPKYFRFINIKNGAEYTTIHTEYGNTTFMTGKWIYFNNDWNTINLTEDN